MTVLYALIAVALGVSSVVLLYLMNKYFAESLKDETRRIVTIFVIFSFAFICEDVLFFISDYTTPLTFLQAMFQFFTLIFCEGLPIVLLMHYHHYSFKPRKSQFGDDDARTVTETRTTMTSSLLESSDTARETSIVSSVGGGNR